MVVPMLYVLSIGPATWLTIHEHLSSDAYDVVYYPLLFVAEVIAGPDRCRNSELIIFALPYNSQGARIRTCPSIPSAPRFSSACARCLWQ